MTTWTISTSSSVTWTLEDPHGSVGGALMTEAGEYLTQEDGGKLLFPDEGQAATVWVEQLPN